MTVYEWSSLDPVCTLVSGLTLVKGASAEVIHKQLISALLAGCGGCTRLACVLTFHLEDESGQQGPMNHFFLSSPKEAQGMQRPNITVWDAPPGETLLRFLLYRRRSVSPPCLSLGLM